MSLNLGQIFENNFSCYADTTDGSEVLVMDKAKFVEVVSKLLYRDRRAEFEETPPEVLKRIIGELEVLENQEELPFGYYKSLSRAISALNQAKDYAKPDPDNDSKSSQNPV